MARRLAPTEQITTRIPQHLVASLDRICQDTGLNRTAVLVLLLGDALHHRVPTPSLPANATTEETH